MTRAGVKFPFAVFFALTIFLGWLLPLFSLLLLSRSWILPVPELSPENWHAHEFYFGFMLSFIVGHLLTVSGSWSKNKDPDLKVILLFCLLFIVDRFLIFFSQSWMNALIYLPVVVYLGKRLWNSRANFFLVLFIFLTIMISKAIFFIPGYEVYGKNLMAGITRFYVVLILSRMWGVYARQSFKDDNFITPVWLHYTTLGISLLLIFPFSIHQYFYPRLILLLGGILIYSLRFGYFKPQITFRKPQTLCFLLAFLWIIYGLILELQVFYEHIIFYYVSYNHTLFMGGFTLFCFGMIFRFLKGMTGEEINEKFVWLILILVNASLIFRIIIPLYEGDYMAKFHLMLSALSWSAAWGILTKLAFIKFIRRVRV